MIDSRTVSIPVMGRIAAGVPISAIQNHTHDIACPPDILTNGEHFALEVKGGHEIVLVVDGSPDNSLDVCRGLIGKHRVPVTVIELAFMPVFNSSTSTPS